MVTKYFKLSNNKYVIQGDKGTMMVNTGNEYLSLTIFKPGYIPKSASEITHQEFMKMYHYTLNELTEMVPRY